jgi:Cu(I)-responsive transcriptional regulator
VPIVSLDLIGMTPYMDPVAGTGSSRMTEEILTIGALAKKTDTKVETIRYYERIELLPVPARTSGNYRAYGAEHLERLSFIRRARDLGFSIEHVRELLSLADQRNRSCARVDAIAHQHLAEVERKLADLNAMRRELSTIIDQCGRHVIADCRIIEALSPATIKSRRRRSGVPEC